MGGDIKGGGLTYYEVNQNQNPNLVYAEGLRVPRVKASLELDSMSLLTNYGKKKSYDRVSSVILRLYYSYNIYYIIFIIL